MSPLAIYYTSSYFPFPEHKECKGTSTTKFEPNDRQGALYNIKCCDCQATYIGENGRNQQEMVMSTIKLLKADYLQNNHRNVWFSAECVIYSTDY